MWIADSRGMCFGNDIDCEGCMHYVISDIHNDNKRFCEMLELIHFSKEDRLFVLGDVFDRSNHNPNPVDLYFNILSLGDGCSMIRGNHDHLLAMYIMEYYDMPERKRKKKTPYPYNSFRLLQKRLTPVDIQNLAKSILEWPVQQMVEVAGEKYLFAHATTAAPQDPKPENYYLQGISHNAFYLHCGIEGYISICGHNNTEDGRIWKNSQENVFMIDCGCGFNSGRLGCLCLETKEEFYV